MNIKDKIINKFKKDTNLNIISMQKLHEYVDFCIDNNVKSKIQGETSHHHILPSSIFNEYLNLKENSWNGVHLTYYNHYYAHWLITEAIDNISMIYAFCAMHFKDVKLKRINKEDLLSEEMISIKMKKRNEYIKESNKRKYKTGTLFGGYKYCRLKSKSKRDETLQANPHILENAKLKHKETKCNLHWKETVGKKQVEKRKETIRNIDKYEENRVNKFKESYKIYQQTDEYITNKFKKDVKQSKINNVTIFNKRGDVVYCVPYLFKRFCNENHLPTSALLNTIYTKNPLYLTEYLLNKAKQKGLEKFEGWYAVCNNPPVKV